MPFMKNYSKIIAQALGVGEKQVAEALGLFNAGATIPFIARYRKDQTGALDEVQLQNIDKQHKTLLAIDKRRAAIIELLKEQSLYTGDLKLKIDSAADLTELEDLYLPYKPKRQTKAQKARELGLEPLAKMIMSQGDGNLNELSKRFVRGEVASKTDALAGAGHIIAEWISENISTRKRLRSLFVREGEVTAKVVSGKEEEGQQFRDYFNYSEPAKRIKPHRILAINRAEEQGILRVSAAPDRKRALQLIEQTVVKNQGASGKFVAEVCKDAYSRLLRPALQTELRSDLKERAEDGAIRVFAANLRQLLMAPPLGKKRVLAIDPGFKSGCKMVALSETGELLGHATIFPHMPQKKTSQARNAIQTFVTSYDIEAIAIGNGTAGRETEQLIKRTEFKKALEVYMVNEDGASVYSASSVGRAEFPQHDVTIRGAVSIGRRLMDPLAELVKIDPRSIGVGQYQHDVNEQKLKTALDQCVELVVNEVGVELNTASPYLLAHISGLGPGIAGKIIDYRTKVGKFLSREQLKEVSGLGAATFEQCAGFLRIEGAENPLDNTAVHPESYKLAQKIAAQLKQPVDALIENTELLDQIDPADFLGASGGEHTLRDVIQELKKPRRDPRRTAYVVEFNRKITRPQDLEIGSEMWGVVTNITNFGAFVDLGVKQDGLVHISELANRFVSDPFEVVKLNQPVKVKVLEVDIDRKRIGLSMKQATVLEPPTK